MPEPPRHLLLDVLGTVVHDPFYEDLPRFLGMSFQELLKAKDPTAWVEFEYGRIDGDEFLRTFFADRRDYDAAGMIQCFRDTYRYLEGMQELLGDLNAAGCVPHLFSNYPDWYHTIEEVLGLSRHAHWSLVSCDTGHRKPDAASFHHAVTFLDADPATCLFVDDRRVNVDAAKASGLQAVLFESATHLRQHLEGLGLLPGV